MEVWEGIDISQFNGIVDFSKVKNSGKTFVMVRAGWCGYDGSIQTDSRFEANMRDVQAVGLNAGVYLYNYAKTVDAAQIAAGNLLKMIEPYRVSYPVVFDMEDPSLQPLGKQLLTDIAQGFLNQIESARYYAALYTTSSWMQEFLFPDKLVQYDWWIADWRQGVQRQPQWGMWQYLGDQGRVNGVQGPCDLDRSYKDYPSIFAQYGLNGFSNTPVEPDPPSPPLPWREQIEQLRQEVSQWKNQYEQLEAGLRALLQNP